MSWLRNSNSLVVVILTICLSILVTSAPSDEGALSDPNIEAIEAAALALPESSFTGDEELLQKADRVNGLTSYRHHGGDKNGKAVFHRKKSDNAKKVVVLERGEDYLKHSSVKRTYIVLRQNPSNPKLYRAFYAYVRDARTDDPAVISIGNKKRMIEFAAWDARGSSKNLKRSLGWTTCFESVYPPCQNDLVPMVEIEKVDPHEIDYSKEEDSSENVKSERQGHTRIIDTKMKSESGVDVPSYYDFFVDLDESEVGAGYIVKTVGTYTYSLSVATASSPPETLILAGIRPTDVSPEKSAEIASIKETDMKLAAQLFKKLNNDSSPIENLPPVGGDPASGRAAGPVDNGRVERLKEQYNALLEKLESLSKLYPVVSGGNGTDEESKTKDTKGPNYELNLLKSKAIRWIKQISEKGMPILEGLLEQSEVGQELKDNPEEGQDLLNEQDSEALKEAVEESNQPPPLVANASTPATVQTPEDLKTKEAMGQKLKLKEDLLQQVRKAKKDQRALKKASQKIKAKADTLKEESTRKGGLLSGGLIGLLLGATKARSMQGRTVEEDPLAGLMGSMMGGALGGDGGGMLGTLASFVGPETLVSLIGPVMNAMGPDGSMSYFKLVTGVGGTLVNKGISKIPLLGGPLSALTGLLGSAAKGAAGIFGLGRSIGEGSASTESHTDTNLFGHIGWRSSEINSEELATLSPKAEEGNPFVGFGNCLRKQVSLGDFVKAQSTEQVVEVYMSVLGTQCSNGQKIQILKLFTSELLKVNGDKSLSINPASPIIKKLKLTKEEVGSLAAAFELSMFSQALLSEYKSPSQSTNPDGSPLTRTVHTFIKAVLNGIDQGRKLVPNHFIKLARNAEISLKTGFTKLLQDYDRYKACSKCTGGVLDQAKNDLLGVTGVMQFIVAGLGPVDHGTKDATSAYKDFFTINRAALDEKLKTFL